MPEAGGNARASISNMSIGVVIRDGRPEEVEAIARVNVQAWRETYSGLVPDELLAGIFEERKSVRERFFEKREPTARLLVVEAADQIVGFAEGGACRQKELGTEAEIYAIYLLDEAKRQGIGRQLMASLFEHLRAKRFASAGLFVLVSNTPARRFYEALGGTPGPERTLDVKGIPLSEVAYRFDLGVQEAG
jgi:ribosomal protein S18 acetylase RimI-like enzyme